MNRFCAVAIFAAALLTTPVVSWAQGTGSEVMLIHASPNAPPVDVLVNGRVVVSDLGYGEATNYYILPSGKVMLQLNAAGTSSPAFWPAPKTFEPGMAYTIVAVGLLNGTPRFGLVGFTDDNSPPSAGMAKVRAIHAAPDTGRVDIIADGNAIRCGLPYKASTGYLEVKPGTYNVKVNSAGTDHTAIGPLELTFDEGNLYTIVAMGQATEGTLGARMFKDEVTRGVICPR